jgi:pimeloyl-ACP methyl ester carboxylesterase
MPEDRERSSTSDRVSLARVVPRQAGFATKWLFAAVALIALLVAVAPWLLPEQVKGLSLETLESRYATPESRFMDLGGVRVHYTDEGAGPAVVLLHASFMNLRSWDSLAESLAANHRVIRLDFLISGLTGPEPNDNYSFDRNRELLDELTERLGLDEFALVSTSSGGIVAFNFAALHPERVTRLVLINSAGLPRTASTDPNRARGNPVMAWAARRYQTHKMVRATLDINFIEPHEPPEWLVDMTYDMRLGKGRQREGALLFASFRTGDPEAVLSKVTAPTLILWGMENQTVAHPQADIFQDWLTGAPTLLKKYPDVGHYLYLEIPDLFEADVGDFLAGRLDQQLSE